jgi:flagellar hook-basal body complex protein FliE
MITPMIAAKAYAAAQSQASAIAMPVETAGTSPSSFAQMVQGAIKDAVQTSKAAEAQMQAQVQGKAQLIDVATAISSAESSLQTVVAVRDEVISAYQQIMQMQI